MKREYGIDLFKIVSTFMILMLHTLTQGGVIAGVTDLTVRSELMWLINIVCFCGVNCFAIISGYLGLNAKHKYSSIIMLWLQVFFTGVAINLINVVYSIYMGQSPNWVSLIKSFFPISSEQSWYFSAYFCLFFFMPLLNKIINTLTKKEAGTIIIVSTVLFMFVETILHNSIFAINAGYTWIWLALLYFIGAYIKKYYDNKNTSIKINLIVFVACVVLTFISRIGIALITQKIFGNVTSANKFIAYTSPLMVIMAVTLLNIFRRLNISQSKGKILSFISSLTFGVYIIHTNRVLFAGLAGKAAFVNNYNILLSVIMLLAIVLALFIICAVFDYLRQLVFKLLRFKQFSEKLDLFITKIVNKINI